MTESGQRRRQSTGGEESRGCFRLPVFPARVALVTFFNVFFAVEGNQECRRPKRRILLISLRSRERDCLRRRRRKKKTKCYWSRRKRRFKPRLPLVFNSWTFPTSKSVPEAGQGVRPADRLPPRRGGHCSIVQGSPR